MKDSDLRGRALKFLYEHRREPPLLFGRVQDATPIPDDIDQADWMRVCIQLADFNLIDLDAEPPRDASTGEVMCLVAKINGFGTDVMEGEEKPPIAIAIDQSQQITVSGSQGVQIAGAHSSQHQTMTDAFEKVITAVDGAAASEADKREAKSLLLKFLGSKVAAAILGPAAGYLAEKLLK